MRAQQTHEAVDFAGLRDVIEQLVTVDLETGELAPMRATAWERVDDTTWRFDLREGVTFHEGSPFDAEVAALAVNWVRSPDNAFHARETMAPRITAEAVGPLPFHGVTESPDSLIPWRTYVAIISSMKQVREGPGEVDETPSGPAPSRFMEWACGQHREAKVDPDWGGVTAGDAYGDGTFERRRFPFRSEPSARAAMVQTGDADLATPVTPEQCAERHRRAVGHPPLPAPRRDRRPFRLRDPARPRRDLPRHRPQGLDRVDHGWRRASRRPAAD